MNSLDFEKITSYTEASMKERAEYFGEAEKNQMKALREAANICIAEKSKEGNLISEISVTKTDISELLKRIYIVSAKLLKDLELDGNYSSKSTFFKGSEPSQLKRSSNKAFEFINNCYDDIKALEENSVIFSYKESINSLKIEVDKISIDKKDNLYSKKSFTSAKNSSYKKWYDEFLLLKAMIRVVVLKHKLNIKDFINEFKTTKKAKDEKKNSVHESAKLLSTTTSK